MSSLSPEDAKQLMSAVEVKAQTAKLPNEDISAIRGSSMMRISIPCAGGDPRNIYITPANAQVFLAADFEYWTFIGNHLAVDNARTQETEFVIDPALHLDHRRLLHLVGIREKAGARLYDNIPPGHQANFRPRPGSLLSVHIAASSAAIQIASLGDHRMNQPPRGATSLYVSGLDSSTRAQEKLHVAVGEVVDAVLFELAVVHGITADLAPFPRFAGIVASTHDTGPEPTVPRLKYSADAMSLFRYAQSATKLPLLQFLAFYQVVEYFFPSYAERDTLSRLRQIVADPAFDVDRDMHLARLSQAIRHRNFLTEKDQLKSTIRHCMSGDDLKQYISEAPEREAFVTDKKGSLKSVRQVSFRDANFPLEDQVAERIYAIRCRIVHAKEGGGPTQAELLLPFSSEARRLRHDIEIMKFVAQKVLIASAVHTKW